jgi:hypothetical protein
MAIRIFPKWIVVLLLVGGGVLAVLWMVWPRAEKYRTYNSPDGRFQIVVFRRPNVVAMPGHSSDASGYFQLREVGMNRILQEREMEMVQLVDRVEWSATNVNVGLLADWKLPQ